MITKATIDRIMEATDIVEVIGEFVQLKKRGANYVGLSPFANERTPSFTVSPAKGILGKIATLTFMFYSMLAASVFLLIACGFQRSNLIYFSVNSWLNLLGMGIICQLFGWLTINHGLRHLPSTKVSVALLSQTVIAGFWAYLLLNEKLGITELIGSVIVLSGIAITFLKPKPTRVKLVS